MSRSSSSEGRVNPSDLNRKDSKIVFVNTDTLYKNGIMDSASGSAEFAVLDMEAAWSLYPLADPLATRG